MPFDVIEYQEPAEETVEVTERLYRTADDRIVREGDRDARWLFAIPGRRIPRSQAEKYGLVEPKAQPAPDEAVESSVPAPDPELEKLLAEEREIEERSKAEVPVAPSPAKKAPAKKAAKKAPTRKRS